MNDIDAEVIRWNESQTARESIIRERMAREGLDPYRWSNRPGDIYSSHSHSYDKVIYVVDGSITFDLPDSGRKIELFVGDRLNLRANVLHGAIVGSNGVICLEAHK